MEEEIKNITMVNRGRLETRIEELESTSNHLRRVRKNEKILTLVATSSVLLAIGEYYYFPFIGNPIEDYEPIIPLLKVGLTLVAGSLLYGSVNHDYNPKIENSERQLSELYQIITPISPLSNE